MLIRGGASERPESLMGRREGVCEAVRLKILERP